MRDAATSKRGRRGVGLAAVAMAAIVAAPGSASAFQCPRLIYRAYAEAGNRFDLNAHYAKQKAAEAARLHAEDKHPEAELLAREGLKLLGLTDSPAPR